MGTLGIVLVTVICRRLEASFAVASFLFLIVILLQSLAGDFLSATLLSIVAVGCLDYFFVDPRHSFAIARGDDAIELLTFLTAALVVTRLVSRVSNEVETVRLERRRQALLYRLAQELLVMDPEAEPGGRWLERFRTVFDMTAMCLFDADTAAIHSVGSSRRGLAEKTRESYLIAKDISDPGFDIHVRRLRVAGRTIGCIGFEGLEDAEATADPLAALAATMLERTRALRDANEASAAAQAEVYRSAILDALAHEFKTPLATILAAAGGVREVDPLSAAQREMIETLETEVERLGSLTSRLLRMARVEREEVRPRIKVMELISLIEELADQYGRRSPDRRISLVKSAEAMNIRADPELLRLAVSQLLDNACKYSPLGSVVSLHLSDSNGLTQIRVSNSGGAIPLQEQQRIFDRFYRGSRTVQTPGSGLGLYIARKIALAHGGTLDLAPEKLTDDEVSFCLTIPSLKGETDHVVTAT